ncbi:MAG: NAD(+) synthase, partial [Proteobacteria bacterium]
TGDVFDEARFIQPGSMKNNYLNFKGEKFFITICEDIWAWPNAKGRSSYVKNPITEVVKKKIDLVINISASPFFPDKLKQREYVTQKTAQYFKAPILYTNLVGAQDEVIYDGASFVLSPSGKALARCQQFEEDLNVINLDTMQAWSQAEVYKGADALRKAIVLGIRDFCLKTGLQKLHLGLSGGIDSAIVICLAVEALGAGKVTAVAMPGPFSSGDSLKLAEQLAKNLGVRLLNAEINDAYKAVLKTLESVLGLKDFGVTQENIQARLRGLFLMAFANKENSLLLTTGNKSEFSTGYSTLYGDMCGGLAPIGDLTKKQVYDLARLYNSQGEVIPALIIDRPPTAELRPDQKDQDSLPAYDLLDASVINIVEHSGPAKSKTDKWLLPMVLKSEFKRWQAPPILKVSEHSFGRGRRWPIAHKATEN